MTRLLMTFLFAVISTSVLHAQAKEEPKPIVPEVIKRTDPVLFDKDILPIFKDKCHVCHSGSLTEGKLDLGTYAAMMKGGKKGATLVAGKADDSLLYKMSAHQLKPIMPPKTEDNPLTPKELGLIKLYIDQGAKPPAVDNKIKRVVTLSLPPALVKTVRAVSINADKTIVAAGRSNKVHLFDAKTGDFKQTLIDTELKLPDGKPANAAHISLVEAMAYSPDGKILATGSFQEVTLWDAETGKPKVRIPGFADKVTTIAFSTDGKMFATGGGAPTEDGEIRIYDLTGKLIVDIKGGHSDTVFGVSFSPDGKLLATASADKFVKVFEVPSGKFVKSFEGHTQHVMDVGWTSDGKKLASAGADNIVKVWDYEKGEKLRDVAAGSKQITRLVFVPKTATFLTCDGDSKAKLWGADNGNAMRTFDGGKDYLYAVAISDDGKIVAIGGEEGTIRIFNGTSGALVKAVTPPEDEKKEEKKDDKKEVKK